MSGRVARATRNGCVLLVALTATSGCVTQTPSSTASPAATTTTATPSATPTATAIPLQMSGHKVGKRYIQITEQKQNRRVYILRADSQTAQRDASGNGTSTFVNPNVVFYPKDGKTLTAVAPSGTVTQQAKTVSVLMSGRVHAHTAGGMKLESDTLRYDDVDETVHARGNVILTTATERLEGGALDADLRFSHVHLSPDAP